MTELHLLKNMKIIITVLLSFLYLNSFAASVPPTIDPAPAVSKTVIDQWPSSKVSEGKKLNFFQKLQVKFVQKKLAKRFNEEGKSNTQTLSTLALIFGSIALVAIFTPASILALLMAPAALVLGIIATGRKDHTKSSRTQALLGLIFGATTIAIALMAILLFVAFWG